MTYFQHSVMRHQVMCRFTLAELELLYGTVQNLLISAHGTQCFATSDNDRPAAERMRVSLNNLLNELGADLKMLRSRLQRAGTDPAEAVRTALGG